MGVFCEKSGRYEGNLLQGVYFIKEALKIGRGLRVADIKGSVQMAAFIKRRGMKIGYLSKVRGFVITGRKPGRLRRGGIVD